MPPAVSAELPLIVLLVRFTVPPPEFKMPPPKFAELTEIAQPLTVKLPPLKMPPPRLRPDRSPPVMVRPEMVTLKLPEEIWKMPNLGIPGPMLLRWTVNRLAPGPLIVRSLLINNAALVRLIVVRPAAKLIV